MTGLVYMRLHGEGMPPMKQSEKFELFVMISKSIYFLPEVPDNTGKGEIV